MKSWGYFIFTAAAVLVFCTRQSSGLELSLCIDEVTCDGCQSTKKPVVDRNNSSGSDNAEAKLVIKNGFMKSNKIVAAAEKEALDGISTVSQLSNIQPNSAANVFKMTIENVAEKLYEAAVVMYIALGEASKLSNNTGRQGLGEANQGLQLFGLEILDQMESLIPITTQAIITGGDAGKQSIVFSRQVIRAAFSAAKYQMKVAFQNAYDAVSSAQNQPKPMQDEDENKNGANDSDANAAISKVNKAASDSIKRGASSAKVEQLRKAFIKALVEVGQAAAHVRDYFTLISKLAETDTSSAKTIYLKESKGVCKRVQEIYANIALDLGAAALKSDSSTRKQLGNAIKLAGFGNIDVTIGNKFAKHLTLFGLLLEDKQRNSTLSAAEESGRYGKIAFIQRLVDAAELALKALSN